MQTPWGTLTENEMKDKAVLTFNVETKEIKRATTPYAKAFWKKAEATAKLVQRWPKWKRELFKEQ
jgi:hypothetical protein